MDHCGAIERERLEMSETSLHRSSMRQIEDSPLLELSPVCKWKKSLAEVSIVPPFLTRKCSLIAHPSFNQILRVRPLFDIETRVLCSSDSSSTLFVSIPNAHSTEMTKYARDLDAVHLLESGSLIRR